MMTYRMPMEKRLEMMTDFGLRASKKGMEFKGSHARLQMVLGKKESKQYRLVVGGGISPIQATALAISNIENW